MKGYLLTSRVAGPVLWAMPPDEARLYFTFQAGDVKARWNLINRCQRLCAEGNLDGAIVLWDALVYLTDRSAYKAEPQLRGAL